MRRVQNRVIKIIVAIILIIGVTVSYRTLDSYLDPFDDVPFDPSDWARLKEDQRGPMARGALLYLRTGLPTSKVRELLGEPDRIARDQQQPFDRFGNRVKQAMTWIYNIGSWSGLGPYGLDSAFLLVNFGDDDCVINTEITGG